MKMHAIPLWIAIFSLKRPFTPLNPVHIVVMLLVQ